MVIGLNPTWSRIFSGCQYFYNNIFEVPLQNAYQCCIYTYCLTGEFSALRCIFKDLGISKQGKHFKNESQWGKLMLKQHT